MRNAKSSSDWKNTKTGEVILEAGGKITVRGLRKLQEDGVKNITFAEDEMIGRFSAMDLVNPETGEIYVEMVEFNAVDCQALIDKALRIVQSSNPEELGKAGRGADDFVCKFCDYRKRCHGVPVVEQVNPETFGWL